MHRKAFLLLSPFLFFLSPPFPCSGSVLGEKKGKHHRKMQALRSLVLRHLRVGCRHAPSGTAPGGGGTAGLYGLPRRMSVSANQDDGHSSEGSIMARVLVLVKKFDKIDATKVTVTADFQKDLSLDSLDRVELAMAFEQEFSIEIPDDKADKLSCCADVAKYILSESQSNNRNAGSS